MNPTDACLTLGLEMENGVLTVSAAAKHGLNRQRLAQAVREGTLVRAAHGVYVSPDAAVDRMYLIRLRSEHVVFSHESALFLHGLSDSTPERHSVTVPRPYSITRLKDSGVNVYTVRPQLHDMGRITVDTPFGHPVHAYDLERTVCDILRCRNELNEELLNSALKRYVRRNDTSIPTLMQYAKAFGIERIVRLYIGILM